MPAKAPVVGCCLIVAALVCIIFPKELNAEPLGFNCTTCLDARLIATEAYIFFSPMIRSYNVFYQQTDGGKMANLNRFTHRTELINANVSTVVSPNDDTLYSAAWLDLRAEPMVLSVPKVPQVPRGRYYSIQFVDGYTHNVEIIGIRTTGHEAGNYLIAESTWNNEVPQSINKTIYAESDYVYCLARIVIYDHFDLPNVRTIQDGLILRPLSTFLGQSSPPSQGNFRLAQIRPARLRTLHYFGYVNTMLKHIRIHHTEEWLFRRFAQIGIGADQSGYPPFGMSEGLQEAITTGVETAHSLIGTYDDPEVETARGWRVSIHPPIFGKRWVMQGRYLDRAVGARKGIYGLDPEEAYYPGCRVDLDGHTLNASKHNYTLTIHPHEVPEVNGFWSITLYNEGLHLVDNEIDRYSIGHRTHSAHLQHNTLTILIQKDKPVAAADVDNWLPAPDGVFILIARIYWPTRETYLLPYLPPGVKKSQNAR